MWYDYGAEVAVVRKEDMQYLIARRLLYRGGGWVIFLGTRECQAYVEPCGFMDGKGVYDETDLSFGVMVHGITYPDEAVREEEKGHMTTRLWNASMQKGIIHFPQPEECEIRKILHPAKAKTFGENNFTGFQEFEGSDLFGLD